MLAKSLSLAESFSSYDEEEAVAVAATEEMSHEGAQSAKARHHTSNVKPHFAATVLASRFAKNTRRTAHKLKDVEIPMLPKPDEPDFSVDD